MKGSLFEIVPYHSGFKGQWDELVHKAVNSSLIHYRDYMEYHQDRFEDRSLVIFQKNRLRAILPLEGKDGELYSHRGLTFGGLLIDPDVNADELIGMVGQLVHSLARNGIKKLSITEVPSFFWTSPEHLSRWWHATASLGGLASESRVFYAVPLPSQVRDRGKRWGMRKALTQGLRVSRGQDLGSFWEKVLVPNLAQRHAAKPVHSLVEIESLHQKFPDTIQLWTVGQETELMGGCILFLHHGVAHCQYLSSTPLGRKYRALDLLFAELIDCLSPGYQFLSLGTAVLHTTDLPDAGLVHWKESWGAKAHPTPSWNLKFG